MRYTVRQLRSGLALLLAATGCGSGSGAGARTAEAGDRDVTIALAADSILAMDTMIARFQAALPVVTTLGDDAPESRDELIRRFIAAIEDSSAAALQAITMNAAEFAYLYFPTSVFVSEPYAQPPAVNWLLMEQNSHKGAGRLLRRYGGRPLPLDGYACTGEPEVEGENRIYGKCTLSIRGAGGDLQDVRMFGSIIERGGRYKLMSLAN